MANMAENFRKPQSALPSLCSSSAVDSRIGCHSSLATSLFDRLAYFHRAMLAY